MIMTDSDRAVVAAARTLWNYNILGETVEPVDAAIVLGSHDLRVADYAVHLYGIGVAPIFVFSGGSAPATRGFYTGTEAAAFVARAIDLGMPQEVALLEERAKNTAENLQFSVEVLREHNADPSTLLLIQKPYMERRSRATADVVLPGIRVICTSPPIAFENYPSEAVTFDHFVNTMVGDTQRIMVYPEKGFMSPQAVPEAVSRAYNFLVDAGYTRRLL
jgi:uncharacterized SAM-binding protein YcdF (DUF218 family)